MSCSTMGNYKQIPIIQCIPWLSQEHALSMVDDLQFVEICLLAKSGNCHLDALSAAIDGIVRLAQFRK